MSSGMSFTMTSTPVLMNPKRDHIWKLIGYSFQPKFKSSPALFERDQFCEGQCLEKSVWSRRIKRVKPLDQPASRFVRTRHILYYSQWKTKSYGYRRSQCLSFVEFFSISLSRGYPIFFPLSSNKEIAWKMVGSGAGNC